MIYTGGPRPVQGQPVEETVRLARRIYRLARVGQISSLAVDWQHTTIPGEIVTTMVVKGLIERDAGGHLSLTDRGRAILRAMLPDL